MVYLPDINIYSRFGNSFRARLSSARSFWSHFFSMHTLQILVSLVFCVMRENCPHLYVNDSFISFFCLPGMDVLYSQCSGDVQAGHCIGLEPGYDGYFIQSLSRDLKKKKQGNTKRL